MADVLSLLVYWGSLAATLLIYRFMLQREYESKYTRAFVLLSLGLPLAVVAGFRNDVGTDYNNYLVILQATASQPWANFFSWPVVEPVFKFLIKIASYISDSKQFLFFVPSYATIEIAFYAFYRLRRKLNMGAAIVLYYLIAYHQSLNIMRQILAASFLLLMVTYLIDDNYIFAIISGIMAMLSHATAAVGLMFTAIAFLLSSHRIGKRGIVYIPNKKANYIYYGGIISVMLAMPILINLVNIIPWLEKYRVYLLSDPKLGLGTTFNFCLLVVPPIILLFKFINHDREMRMFKNILLLYLPLSIMGYFAPWASRLNVYTVCLFSIYVPLLYQKTKRSSGLSRKGKLLNIYYWGIFLLKYGYEILYLNYNHTFPYFR